MKHLAQLCAATVLTLTLAFAAFAGDAPCPGVVAPPPPPTSTSAGGVDCLGLTELAESLIQSVLSLS
jgi:hypothetical protein